MTHPLSRILGLDRINYLLRVLATAATPPYEFRVGTITVMTAILIGLLPPLAVVLSTEYRAVDVTMFFTGLAAVLSIIYRRKHGIPFSNVAKWQESLSLTHTAFAMGCIPVVLIVVLHHDALFSLRQHGQALADKHEVISLWEVIVFIVKVSVWAAITEEFIYRGLVISVVRRWRYFSSPFIRDCCAVLISSLLFSLAHIPTWGSLVGFMTFFLGVGLGIAYVAIGELILPLVVYHAAFDALSLAVAIFSGGRL